MAKWLSGCESKSVLVEFFYSFSFLRNLSYLIRITVELKSGVSIDVDV